MAEVVLVLVLNCLGSPCLLPQSSSEDVTCWSAVDEQMRVMTHELLPAETDQ